MTDGTDVDVRLSALEFRLSHLGPPQDSSFIIGRDFARRSLWVYRVSILVGFVSSCNYLLALALLNDLVSDSLWNLSVGLEGHRVDRTARSLRAQVTDVTEHFRQWN